MTVATAGMGALLAVALAGTSPARAEGLAGSGLRINGFGTVGLVQAAMPEGFSYRRELNSYARTNDHLLWDVDTRVGLQAFYPISPRLDAMAQLVMRRRADGTPHGNTVQWAYLAWRPTDSTTLRIGRLGADMYILSDYRNVGHAYTMLRPPQEVYGILSVNGLDGIDITRQFNVANTRWRLRATWGESPDLHIDTGNGRPSTSIRLGRGLIVSARGEWGDWAVRGSYSRMTVSMPKGDQLRALQQGIGAIAGNPAFGPVASEAATLAQALNLRPSVVHLVDLGLTYDAHPWTVTAEAMHISSAPGTTATSGGYVMVGRRIGNWTPYGIVAYQRNSPASRPPAWGEALSPYIGVQQAAQVQALGAAASSVIYGDRTRQQTLSVGTRWDVHPQVAIKAQYDHVFVNTQRSLLWSSTGDSAAHADVNVFSLTLDYMF